MTVSITSLWLPILLSAVFVFVAAAIVWMALPHHKKEWKGLSNQEAARTALKGTAPGQYVLPYTTPAGMNDPAFLKKREEGPTAWLTVVPPGVRGMGPQMIASLVYYLAVGVLAAYVAGRTLDPGTPYLQVFRVVGTVTWAAYGWGAISDGIWFGKPWSSVAKQLGDALLYALLTAGTFGWLWPDM
ncbi:MAG: hypothetical protein HYW06_11890 [Gemmatimonadetes bacterium]|nr:hypothetical protein [Gemmatimonadota bacterium]MBI2537637.1 hypothetical protein [Gemmatimonadota bacterium]